MSKYGPHLSTGGWFISRMYRHSPSNLIIKGLWHHTHRREDCSPLVCPDGVCGRSYGGVFAWVRGLLLLLLKVERPFHSGFPALGLALGLGQLHHKEGKNNHGTKKGKHWDSLAHLLIIATGHYSWGKTETLITAMHWLNSKSPFCGWQLVDYFLNTQQKFLTSRDVPGSTFSRRQGSNLRLIWPHIRQNNLVHVHWQ